VTLLSDTSPEAEQVLIELLRQAPIWRKLELMGQLNAMAKSLTLNNLRRQYPHASEEKLRRQFGRPPVGTGTGCRCL
jgi:hypothetical protein